MVSVIRTFQVPRSPRAVREYLQDFSRATEWDPGTVSCEREDGGPVGVGSRWRNVSKFFGNETELTYELVRHDEDRLVFRGENGSATAVDDIAIAPGTEEKSTAITYRATIDFHGAAKLAGPVAKIGFEQIGDQTVTAMTDALERDVPRG